VPNASAPWLWTGSALVLSAVLTAASISYARHRKLIDEPGMRRSHSVPTPRGGGIGIVVAIVVCGLLPSIVHAPFEYRFPLGWLIPGIAGIALVGWIDDHGGLSAGKRFAMHCAVTLWTFVVPLLPFATLGPFMADLTPMLSTFLVAGAFVAALVTVWSINLHNFMDGIDGILSMQSIFVFWTLAALFARADDVATAWQLTLWAAAVLGFLPFNFPRARVFMGDVGSGVLGFLIAVAVIWQILTPRIAFATGFVACSAFVTDATCTLLSRIWRGRRWYSAHREHLYQWLVRCGHSHARVVALYMGWNLLIVLPVICWMNRSILTPASYPDAAGSVSSGLGAAVAVYALAVAVWFVRKRRCLAAVRMRGRHATT
jgi:UDP-N-acetylmuramyl pentapeptide phosphotransferase/UDP-N-acetylglucosamine-1-phosphate transferase